MARPRPDRRYLLLLLVVPVIAVATCAGGGEETFRTDRPALRLTLDEYRITPQQVRMTTTTGRIKFIARNVGRLTHNLVIQIPAAEEGERPVDVPGGRMGTAQSGEELDPIKLTLQPGTYRMVCTIANHDDLGQYGELRVVEE